MPSCTCLKPPGEHSCPEGYAAFCESRFGRCAGRCSPVSAAALTSELELARWTFSYIYRRELKLSDLPDGWAEILAQGSYTNPENGRTVRFALPKLMGRQEEYASAAY